MNADFDDSLKLSPKMQELRAKLLQLPEDQQEAFAAMFLEEMDDEAEWKATVERTKDKLSKLEDKVREEIRSGRHDDGDW